MCLELTDLNSIYDCSDWPTDIWGGSQLPHLEISHRRGLEVPLESLPSLFQLPDCLHQILQQGVLNGAPQGLEHKTKGHIGGQICTGQRGL